jgi:hypothetical protein
MIVYTAIIGNPGDCLRPIVAPPDPQGRIVQYVCFTDQPTSAAPAGWEIRPPIWRHDNPRRTARWHKVMAHVALGDRVEHSIWMDATHQLEVNPWMLIERYLIEGRDIALFRHPLRSCVYQEHQVCARMRLDDETTMRNQMDRYRQDGYPPGRGLFEASAVLRVHSTRIREFNERWWQEIDRGSLRDQLSVNYAAWKLRIPVAYLAGCRAINPYFNFYRHRSATSERTGRPEAR